jgi:hypothetical protein
MFERSRNGSRHFHVQLPPKADRTLSNTVSVRASMVAYDTLTITLKEFWPDIWRKLQKK